MGNKLFVKSAPLAFGEISQEGVGRKQQVCRPQMQSPSVMRNHAAFHIDIVILCELGLYKVSGVCMGGSE